jgi:hypothetical protein
MDEARVARRCFDLIQELLEFAQNHVQQRQRIGRPGSERLETQYPHSLQALVSRYGMDSTVEADQSFSGLTQSISSDSTWAMNPLTSGIWASMMDPIALESFVVGDEPIDGMVYDDSWIGGDVME